MEMVRLVSSGTEATMTALRLARGFTGRPKIIKFDGCYHGHGDSLLVKAGSGALTFGHPDSLGVPANFAKLTLVLPYNETEPVKAAFAANKNEIACIIVEPVPGNAGLYLPRPGYLEFLKKITQENGALLIFDEVMTGFRLAPGGAQERFGIRPDLSTFGKLRGARQHPPRTTRRAIGSRNEAGCEIRRRAGDLQPLRLDVLRLLHQQPSLESRRRDEERPRTLQGILPRYVGSGHLSRPIAI